MAAAVVDANSLYYTLSTIAQTLAATLAILVTSVLFKLAYLDKEREDIGTAFARYGIDADPGLGAPCWRVRQAFDTLASVSYFGQTATGIDLLP